MNRLKDYEGIGINLTYRNRLEKVCTLNAKLTYVSKDSIVLMDCYKKEYIIKRDRIIDFVPVKYKPIKPKK